MLSYGGTCITRLSIFHVFVQGTMIVDPATVALSELTGQERVGVINRNTREKVGRCGLNTTMKCDAQCD